MVTWISYTDQFSVHPCWVGLFPSAEDSFKSPIYFFDPRKAVAATMLASKEEAISSSNDNNSNNNNNNVSNDNGPTSTTSGETTKQVSGERSYKRPKK